jgi:hypothetical protein
MVTMPPSRQQECRGQSDVLDVPTEKPELARKKLDIDVGT